MSFNATKTLVITSLLTLLLSMFHVADDMVRGMAPGTVGVNVPAMLFWVVWLYGTLVLTERRSGYIIILVASLFAAVLPLIHMMNKGGAISPRIAASTGGFFFAWTLLAIGVTATFAVILSARGLWMLRQGQNEIAMSLPIVNEQ